MIKYVYPNNPSNKPTTNTPTMHCFILKVASKQLLAIRAILKCSILIGTECTREYADTLM
jgi:hypothetical protein